MDKVLILDFGGQYDQLIARRVREQHVYAEIRPFDRITLSEIIAADYRGIIFTGGPRSVRDPDSPSFDRGILDIGVPLLGICYGAQLIAHLAGGEVSRAESSSEYGKVVLSAEAHPLFEAVPRESICWMSHTDYISALPEGFRVIAATAKCPCAGLCDDAGGIYGVQFHPEVTHTEYGRQILYNFLYSVCKCRGDWDAVDYAGSVIEKYRSELAGKKVLLALSGGVDSSVAAILLHRAVGANLTCVFVDHGLLRKGEGDYVERTLGKELGVNVIRVDAEKRFLEKLSGVSEPEKKRKIIGNEFIRVFEEEAAKIGRVYAFAQGTIYPDVIESGKGTADVIKSHHNVGGLPSVVKFDRIVEPLRDLFKDEVRTVGTSLGLPRKLVWRQPFPGPGLGVRIIGEVTREKLEILREADAIFREEVEAACGGRFENCSGGVHTKGNTALQTNSTGDLQAKSGKAYAGGKPALPDQYFAVLTDTRTVGVMGDARTYGYTAALRAVATDDFMTAEWSRLPLEALGRASSRITNEVAGISRVVYDISSKPPATVEWE